MRRSLGFIAMLFFVHLAGCETCQDRLKSCESQFQELAYSCNAKLSTCKAQCRD